MGQLLWTKRDLVIAITLSLAIIIIYWPVQKFKLVNYDDEAYVTERPQVMAGLTWSGAKWAMSSTDAGFWHPLTWLSLMADRELYKSNAGGFHWTNVILHLFNTLLLFILLRAATEATLRSAVVALLFAIHPLHVESVAWVSQRKDLLCTLFGFASLWAHVRYARSPGWRRYSLVAFFFILGLMSKPMIVTFPFVMLLLDYWPLQRLAAIRPNSSPTGRRFGERSFIMLLLEKLPLLVLSFSASILVIFTEKKAGALTNLENLSFMERAANAILSYLKYMAMMFWPTGLTFFYPHPVTIPPLQVLGAITILISLTFFIIRLYRSRPYLPVGWLWYLGTLLPVIGLIQVGPQALADRYTYVPLIGLFIIIVWGAIDLTVLWKHKDLFLGAIGLSAFAGLALLTSWQIGYWRNSITLFERSLQVTQGNYIALNNLGFIYIQKGEVDKGISYIEEGIKANPRFGLLYHNLGLGMYVKGNYEKAIECLTKAQSMSFRGDDTPRYLGDAYRLTGRNSQAMEAYRQALALNGGNLLARYGLALVLDETGRHEEAIKELRNILAIDEANIRVRKQLMKIYLEMKEFRTVLAEGERALAIDPRDPEITKMMGRASGTAKDSK